MLLNIIGRNLNAGDDLKNVIEKKFEKLDKYFSDDIEANVVLSQEKGRQKMEATINAKGIIFRAEETSGDFFDSVDQVVDKLSAQMSKFKGKIRNRYKDNKSLKFEAFGAPLPEDEEAMNVVKRKKFVLEPMTVDDAIVQMEMLQHTFFIFLNVETDTVNLVYRRNDNNYGLLETEY